MYDKLKAFWVSTFILLGATGMLLAQDEGISDVELKDYAIIEMAKNSIVNSISPMVNELIEKQEGMTGTRFQELMNCKGDAAKLSAANAQEWEIKFLNLVNGQIDKRKTAAGEVVKLLAGNTLGAARYNSVKQGLGSDPELKARYDAIWESLNN